MSRYRAAWLVLGFVAGGIEAAALVRRASGDTLSESIRVIVRRSPVARGAFIALSVWAPLHILLPKECRCPTAS